MGLDLPAIRMERIRQGRGQWPAVSDPVREEKIHRRDAKSAEKKQRSNNTILFCVFLRLLCALCVSAVNLPYRGKYIADPSS